MTESILQFQHKAKPAAPEIGDYEAMLERARALVPVLKERAAATESLRRLPPETERDLHKAGLFRILQPKRVGGPEFDYVALVDFSAELARGDAAAAWNFANLASHHWMLGMFPPAAQDLLWNEDPDVLIASSFVFPAGGARRVEGGYRLSGRWPFSSGVEPSRWNILAGVVTPQDETEASEMRMFLVPSSAYRIVATWDAMGLGGTGSHDVETEDLFVPDVMTLGVHEVAGGPAPGSAVNPAPLYRLPVFSLFPFVLSGTAVGNAQACLDDYVASARSRLAVYSKHKVGDFQSTQIRIAAAAARIDVARAIMRSACIEAMEDARQGRIPGLEAKTRYRRDGAFSVNLCTEAVSMLFSASGAGGLFKSGGIEKRFRDAHAINAHIAFNFDAAGSNFGRALLGLPSENPAL
jgi:3-hydroxy-9,10-secoandrosta-1,3,5(10)-triene-9,17-dione monooxygenase